LNEKRLATVNALFNYFDIGKTGFVELEELKQKLNPAKHPAVMEGRKTEKNIIEELSDSIDSFIKTYNKGTGITKFSKEDLISYYTNVSACIESDEYFIAMIKNCWNLEATLAGDTIKQIKEVPIKTGEVIMQKFNEETKDSPFKSTIKEESAEQSIVKEIKEVKVEPPYHTQEEEKKSGNIVPANLTEQKTDNIVLNRFRSAIFSRGILGIFGIERQFKAYSKNQQITIEDFIKTVEDFHLNVESKVFLIK
jgi:DNA-directed RNA polymerase delta subunit